jgi:hypothetical protein
MSPAVELTNGFVDVLFMSCRIFVGFLVCVRGFFSFTIKELCSSILTVLCEVFLYVFAAVKTFLTT